jgi:DNA-binding NarL/FixJ family response regulator
MDFVGEKPVGVGTKKGEDRVEIVAGLAVYLAKLGLVDGELDQMITMLQIGRREETPDEIADGISMEGAVVVQEPASRSKGTIGLFLAEEQQVLRGTYQASFETHDAITLLDSASDVYGESLIKAAEEAKPDVVFLEVKALRPAILESLHELKEDYDEIGLVLIASSYDDWDLKSLRSIPIGGPLGTAYLYKHTMDTLDQMARVIKLVAEGRIIVDPKVMAGLIEAEQSVGPIPQLTPAMDAWDVGVSDMESGAEKDDVTGAPRTVQGSLKDACAALEQGGICVDRAVFKALVCLSASGMLSSYPR